MVGLLCYPVAILTMIIYITVRQPALIESGQGLMLVRRFRWLFNRFTPERYSPFGLAKLLRQIFP